MKVILFANTDWYLYNFRLPLAQALRSRGDSVTLVSPDGPYVEKLQLLGFKWVPCVLDRRSYNIIGELATLMRLLTIYRRERPDLVHHFTIKCVLYGSLVAKITDCKTIINSVTGLGWVFSSNLLWLRLLVGFMYQYLLKNTGVIFQNPEDMDFFLKNGWVMEDRSALIRGSGVDTNRFVPSEEPKGVPVIMLPARLLWQKGVKDFVMAARFSHNEGYPLRWVLVGDTDSGNRDAVPAEKIAEWSREGIIEWWGWMEGMETVLPKAVIVCLPSISREGTPKVLLEAAACGRAIITYDVPGCREVVHNNVNGLLVPVRDWQGLVQAAKFLIENPEERYRMAGKGRVRALKEFSTEKVVEETLQFYAAIEAGGGTL